MEDIKALIINLRESKNSFKSGYRPAFDVGISEQYLTTGRINFGDPDFFLYYNQKKEASVSFIAPDIYPRTLWVGRILSFYEGNKKTGEAEVLEIYNQTLMKES